MAIDSFQRPIIRLTYVNFDDFKQKMIKQHDEDLPIFDIDKSHSISGINRYTGNFYGIINILIIK